HDHTSWSVGWMPTRIFCRSKLPERVWSRTCVKIAARGGNADGRSRSSSLGRVRPKPEASSTKRGSWTSTSPSAARQVTLGRAPLKSTAVISTSKRNVAPWRCASAASVASKSARGTWKVKQCPGLVFSAKLNSEYWPSRSNTAPFLNWKLRATTASNMPASVSSSMLQASRLSPIEKRGNFCRSSTSTLKPRRASNAAELEPEGPAPMINTSVMWPSGNAQRDQHDGVATPHGEHQRAAALGSLAQLVEIGHVLAVGALDAVAGAQARLVGGAARFDGSHCHAAGRGV